MVMEPEDPLSDTEKEMIHYLKKKSGLRRNEARVLVLLSRGFEYSYKDLVAITGASQSAQNIGVARLLQRGYAIRTILIRERDRHPITLFRLKMSSEDVCADLFHRFEEKHTEGPKGDKYKPAHFSLNNRTYL